MEYHLKRIGFRLHSVYKMKKPSAVKIAKQKMSFFIASMSLFAFVVGNMVGQHGWYTFWRTVLGKEDDSVPFVGTVSPIERVPNYEKWMTYGGSSLDHTFRMVPSDLLVPIPAYDPAALSNRTGENLAESVYSVGWLGSYATGAEMDGSHVGVDIRVPVGTPVLSIANGIVQTVSSQEYGFGHHIVIRHPSVPDPENPSKLTTIYSVYAHLDALLVTEGQIVHKGQNIALSGRTGDATGPHLHFQIDRGDAPFHPYWPFTGKELADAHLSFNQGVNSTFGQANGKLYTLNPMAYVQAHQGYTPQVASVSTAAPSLRSAASPAPLSVADRRSLRLRTRVSRAGVARPINTAVVAVGGGTSAPVLPSIPAAIVADSTTETSVPSRGSTTDVDHLSIEHSGKLSRTWQKVKIRTLDRNNATVNNPSFTGKIYIISEFGDAEIRPSEITPAQFVNGVATINVLTRGVKTTILSTRGAFTTTSAPLVYQR